MNEFLTINPENKSGKIKLNDIVMQPVMDRLIDEIGKIFGAQAMADGADFGELMNCAENAVDTLEIEIHSPGGSVLDGYTLYNELMALRSRGVHVTATINLAASMASVIAMAADVIRIYPTGRMMIHEVSQGVRGTADELRKSADLCESMTEEIAEIYATRTGQPIAKVKEMMKAETWLSAKQAVAAGFANEIFDIRPVEAKPAAMNILKMLFPGNEAELSQVEAALAEVDSLRNDVAMFTSEVATLKSEVANKDQALAELGVTVESLTTAKADLESALAAASADLAAKDETIAAKDAAIEEAKASAGNIAIETLAAIGQPEPLPLDAQIEPSATHLETFNSLKGAEATAYFNKFEKEIAAEQRASAKS